MLKKAYAVLLFLLATIFSLNAELLRVGMELTYPPFEMIDKDGNPAGISVDIANGLGEYLDQTVLIENIPFVGLIPALKSSKIRAIISSMTVTEERKLSIDFSDPYLRIGLCFLVSMKSTLHNVQDANQSGRVIAVKQGTTGQIYAEKNLTKAKILVLDKESSCVMEVVQGKADAFIYDQLSVYAHWQKHPNTTRALLEPFAIEYWAIGLRKGDDEFKQQVNNFLKQFRDTGGVDRLGDTYFKEQKAAFKKLGISLSL